MSNTTEQKIEDGEHWISVSDLMSGLMMVFLFISVALMQSAFKERDKIKIDRDKIKEIAITYQNNQVALYNALMQEFKDDLSTWEAKIDKTTLSFNFQSPDVLFDLGKITLKPRFKEILNNFFPRYLITLKKFNPSIDEVRIEGHTSSMWNSSTSADIAYFNNMELSQGRTRSVLAYIYALSQSQTESDWIMQHVAAVGFSSARLILNKDGIEDQESSRRVSFRVITNAEIQIRKIVEN